MSSYPIFQVEAVEKRDLASFTPVWNSDEVEYYLWIHVPQIVGRDFELYQIDEMVEPVKELTINDACYHQHMRPWYRLLSPMLNLTPGLHVYRMGFVNRHNSDVISLFFAYVIQCDHPKKPYKYMEPSGRCGCCEENNS